MKAIQITSLDGPAAVELREVAEPPADDKVLIRVRAAGVAFPEVLQSRGLYQFKPELPFTPGSEVAGEVISAPEGSGFAPGDRVAGFPFLGGYAEVVASNVDMTFALPDSLSFEKAAALPMNYLTAYFCLLERGQMKPGESVLVHGAAGGVGTASIQVAKAFGAGHVLAVVSTDAKGEIALQAGADEYVLADSFKDAAKARGGVDLVLDPVGGDRFTDSLRSLRRGGRLLVVGFTAGQIPTVQVNRLLLNNISVVGAAWGETALAVPGHMAMEWAQLAPHIESGALDPVLGPSFPLADAAQALAELDERRAVGKIILTV
jgi:NADPH2:quinone reductase